MVNVVDAFAHLDGLSTVQLFERRAALIGSAPTGNFHELSDEALQELVAIAKYLRKKAVPATKTPRAASVKRGPVVTNLDAL
jgi:hypothetical protein